MNAKLKMAQVAQKQLRAAEAYYSKSQCEARHRLSLEVLCRKGLASRSIGNGYVTYVMAIDGFTYRFAAVVA